MEIYQGIENKKIKNILKGILISFITSILLLAILSAVLAYTDVSENIINPAIIVITAISILIGSSLGNIKIKKNGLLNGAIIGGVYILLLYLISSIAMWEFNLNLRSIIMIAIGIIFGVLGGIIVVNRK